jgi:hypothetical protein
VLNAAKQVSVGVLDVAKSAADFELARGRQQVAIVQARSAGDVAVLQSQTDIARAQAQVNSAQRAADKAGQGGITDQLAGGKYNTLILMLTLAGLGFAYLQTVRQS